MDVPDLFYEEEGLAPMRTEHHPRRLRVAIAPRTKNRSVILPTDPIMEPALKTAERNGDVVTSGSEGNQGDGVHSPSSQHYTGTAIDLRLGADPGAYRALGYVVVVEKDHLHVQAYPA